MFTKTCIQYCRGWSRYRKEPSVVITENEARALHDNGDTYTVLCAPLNCPQCFLDINGSDRFVGVIFLDEELRQSSSYHFQADRSDTPLFLSEFFLWRYSMNSVEWSWKGWLGFQKSGTSWRQIIDLEIDERIEDSVPIQLTDRYQEAFPVFGNYEAFFNQQPLKEWLNLLKTKPSG